MILILVQRPYDSVVDGLNVGFQTSMNCFIGQVVEDAAAELTVRILYPVL